MRWQVVLLEQDDDAFTFGAAATVIADLGEVPAERENFYDGDPEWDPLLSRIEIAGYDAGQQMFRNELVPFGLWMRCEYLAPARSQPQHIVERRNGGPVKIPITIHLPLWKQAGVVGHLSKIVEMDGIPGRATASVC